MSKKLIYTCEVCSRESIVGREFVWLRDEHGSTVVCKVCVGQLGDQLGDPAVRARHAAKPIMSPTERLAYDVAYEDARERKKREEREAYAASSEGRLDALEERVAALEALLKKEEAP